MGPKGKVGLLIAFALVLAAILTPIEYAPVAFLLLLGWAAVNKVSVKLALGATVLFGFSMAITGIILGFGIERGILTAFRTISIVLPMYTYISCSKMQDILETMDSFRVPKDFSFMFSIAVPYSHVMGRKAQQVRIAQKCRESRSPWAFMMPILEFVFERARKLAISIESRGWSPEPESAPSPCPGISNKNV